MDCVREYMNQLIENSTPENPKFNVEATKRKMGWNYVDGVVCKAVLDLYDMNKDEKLLEFVDKFIGWYIGDNGKIEGYNMENYNIDSINCGKVLFRLYEYTKKEKYKLG